MKPEDWQDGGFALYVHWPFCKAKCPYCDFNSHVRQSVDADIWQQAYLSELDRAAVETGGRVLRSVFFGGGTPSLMEPSVVGAVLDRVAEHWRLANDLEVTLEANPTSAEAGRFAGYHAAGVNRISLGLQALNDADLRALGRQHTAQEALAAYEMARARFDRVSGDLIYARQGQTANAWETELRQMLALEPDHLSLYQLTIEDGTAFGDLYQRGRLRGLPDEDESADLYQLTTDICGSAGLPAYEISNHAVPGAESRHNLVYWRMGDYVGIGPGAHGRLTLGGTRQATDTLRSPEEWLTAVLRTGSGELAREILSNEAQGAEYLMMSLRLAEGMSLARFSGLSGVSLARERISDAVEQGHLWKQGDRIGATPSGRLLLNRLALALLS